MRWPTVQVVPGHRSHSAVPRKLPGTLGHIDPMLVRMAFLKKSLITAKKKGPVALASHFAMENQLTLGALGLHMAEQKD